MRLRVVDHLHPVFDGAKQTVCSGKIASRRVIETARCLERFDRVQCCGRAHRSVATTMNHLLDLDEEFDFANATSAALQIVSGPAAGTLREMVADTRGYRPHFLDHAEIERAAPYERMDGIEEPLT